MTDERSSTGAKIAGFILFVIVFSFLLWDRVSIPAKETFPVIFDMTAQDKMQAEEALASLKSKCSDLFLWGSEDVQRIRMKKVSIPQDTCHLDYLCERYKWYSTFWVEVDVVENPQWIAPSHRAAGHTLHYRMGSGISPGIVAKKEQSMRVCGWQPRRDGADIHVSVPALSFIDNTPAPPRPKDENSTWLTDE